MKQDHDRIQYSYNLYMTDYLLDNSIALVSSFDARNTYDINDIIELYNAIRNLTKRKTILSSNQNIDLSIIDNQVSLIKKQLGIFFSVLSDDNILSNYKQVIPLYLKDFWYAFEEYKIYNKITKDAFKSFMDERFRLAYIIKHRHIVSKYDELIKEYMVDNVQESIQVLIKKHFPLSTDGQIYLPNSLTTYEIEKIFDAFVSLETIDPNMLENIVNLPQKKECPISDMTRTRAKEKRDLYIEKFFNQRKDAIFTNSFIFQISSDLPESVGANISYDDSKLIMSISKDWIKNNTDYPTLLNNFIYLLGVVDNQARICNIYKNPQTSLFSLLFNQNNQYQKMYPNEPAFNFLNNSIVIAVMGYSEFLSNSCDIRIENVIEWFFTTYLKEEFKIDGFYAFMPSQESTYLEKCRSICCEMESIIKQYSSYVRFNEINHNLIENFSGQTLFENVPSLISDKYVYLQKIGLSIAKLLFEERTISFIQDKKVDEKECFYDLIKSTEIYYDDYTDFQKKQIDYLIKQDVISIDISGVIRFVNEKEISILRNIYLNEFGTRLYYKSIGLQKTIEEMMDKDWIKFGSTFLSKNEADYFNYYLNKRDFANGLDLRNRYLHGTQPKRGADIDLHRKNYYTLMMLLIVLVIKINDELCAIKGLTSNSFDQNGDNSKTY